MRKKWISTLLAMLFCAALLTMPAFAAENQDGLQVSLTTDKTEYRKDEAITATLTVTNTGKDTVENLTLENEIPAGYQLAGESQPVREIETLRGGETVTATVTYLPKQAGATAVPTASAAPEKTAAPAGGDENTTTGGSNTTTESNTTSGGNTAAGAETGSTQAQNTAANPVAARAAVPASKIPATGDEDCLQLWLVLAALGLAGLLTIIALKKKKGEKLLSLFLAFAVVGTTAVAFPTQAKGAAKQKTIRAEAAVTIDGTETVVQATVKYDAPAKEPAQAGLKNLAADEVYFIVDEDSAVTFTVEAAGVTEPVLLYCGDTVAATMHDDGKEGDSAAQDGIYTCVVTRNEAEAASFDYCAKSGSAASEIVTIYFFGQPTQEDVDAIDEVQNGLQALQEQHEDETGYVPREAKQALMAEIEAYLAKQQKEQVVLLYEVEGNAAYIKLTSGLAIHYEIPTEGVSAGGSDVALSITNCQPHPDLYITDAFGSELELIAQEFGSTVSTYKSEEVTPELVKSIGPNQVVLWNGHGGYDSIRKSTLATGETFNLWKWLSDDEYHRDFVQERLIKSSTEAQKNLVCITSKFVDEYCGDLSNDIILLDSCHGGQDETLANSFVSKGATAVLGFTDMVCTWYSNTVCYEILQSMTFECNPYTNNYYTLAEALQKAIELNGEDDIEFMNAHPEKEYSEALKSKTESEAAAPVIFGGEAAENCRLREVTGTISGKVCLASDRQTPVDQANVEIYRDDEFYTTVTTDAQGNYSRTLPAGDYRIEIKADGYVDFTAYATITKDNDSYMETFLLVEGEEGQNGMAQGIIGNAITGTGVEGVTLQFRKGWNNTTLGEVVAETVTDSNGAYTVALPLGNYTMYATKEGFVPAAINIITQAAEGAPQNGSITPNLSGDDCRVVLTWGENPRDLDSHVVGRLPNGDLLHVYYGQKSHMYGETEVCNLDRDDTNSYGPETVTLKPTGEGPYYYYIYRYAGTGTVASSGAQVKVYQGETLLATYNVPTNQGDGDYWNVFAIANGGLVPRNTVTPEIDADYASRARNAEMDNLSSEGAAGDEKEPNEFAADELTAEYAEESTENLTNTAELTATPETAQVSAD